MRIECDARHSVASVACHTRKPPSAELESKSAEFGMFCAEFTRICAEYRLPSAESALWSAYVLVRRQREVAGDEDVHRARHRTVHQKLRAPES